MSLYFSVCTCPLNNIFCLGVELWLCTRTMPCVSVLWCGRQSRKLYAKTQLMTGMANACHFPNGPFAEELQNLRFLACRWCTLAMCLKEELVSLRPAMRGTHNSTSNRDRHLLDVRRIRRWRVCALVHRTACAGYRWPADRKLRAWVQHPLIPGNLPELLPGIACKLSGIPSLILELRCMYQIRVLSGKWILVELKHSCLRAECDSEK